MLAYDFPILGLFWTMLIFFIWVAWIVLVIRVFVDIFRSDIGGLSKALWSLFVIFLPFLGVLIYLIAHGDSMVQRNIDDAQRSDAAFQAYVRDAAGAGGVASELSKLSELRSNGTLTDAEFEAQKAKLLAG
ncbi:MAG TPA: SHOCT domain-containing protein [Acidimicrobiales bacterium]|nr:SHOCT domain-containing protein [Acidimicrobiales bacterium]